MPPPNHLGRADRRAGTEAQSWRALRGVARTFPDLTGAAWTRAGARSAARPRDALPDLLLDCADAVAPGGHLLVLGHDRDNVEHGVGGPPDPDVLYDVELLKAAAGLDVEPAEQVSRQVGDDVALATLLLARRCSTSSERSAARLNAGLAVSSQALARSSALYSVRPGPKAIATAGSPASRPLRTRSSTSSTVADEQLPTSRRTS